MVTTREKPTAFKQKNMIKKSKHTYQRHQNKWISKNSGSTEESENGEQNDNLKSLPINTALM